jgi:hypothetical protein
MSKHPSDLPGWLGTARRERTVEEPGRPGRVGKGNRPNGPRECITEGTALAGSRRGSQCALSSALFRRVKVPLALE